MYPGWYNTRVPYYGHYGLTAKSKQKQIFKTAEKHLGKPFMPKKQDLYPVRRKCINCVVGVLLWAA